MTRYGIVCGGELDNKKIKVNSTGRKDIYGKIIWKSDDRPNITSSKPPNSNPHGARKLAPPKTKLKLN